MTKDQILNGNKLMAEYLGYKYYPYTEPYGKDRVVGWVKPRSHPIMPEFYLGRSHNDLDFNTNWNNLIRVVEKIERDNNVVVSMVGDNIAIHNYNKVFIKRLNQVYSKRIENLWNVCLKFIKNEINYN